jgi:hypothetical protein
MKRTTTAACLATVTALMSLSWHPGAAGAKPPATGSTVKLPPNIASDCSKAVDQSINAFVAKQPPGTTVLFKGNGCYGIDNQLEVVDGRDLVLDGRGSTFKTLTPGDICRANWRITGGSNITLQNMIVRGANTTGFDGPRPDMRGQCQHGYSFHSTQGGKLLDSKAFDTLGDPVSIQPDPRIGGDYCAVPPNRDILVDNFYGFNSGRTVGITHADGVTIQNSWIGDMYDNAIDLETDADCETMRNVRILNNRFGRTHFAVVSYSGGEPPERSGNFEFSNNVVEATPNSCYPALYLAPLGPIGGTSQYVGYRDGFVIRNNDVQTFANGFEVHKATNVVVEGNVVRNNYGFGCANPDTPWYPYAYGTALMDVHGANVARNTMVDGGHGVLRGELFADANSTGITQNP